MARWFSARRREAAQGTLHPAYGEVLSQVPGWDWNPRKAAEEAQWHRRLAQLVDFREQGNDWPRHKKCDSERGGHTLGLWAHASAKVYEAAIKKAGGELPASVRKLARRDN
ncbi:hypothetical protein DBZ45_09000 [Arthrobacter globiformis]|uniref:Helicase-associated domain-containing protein n=1 Tax=Arthrobacter globiformis TaxID=1665 RepID=A0A328HGQ6_ARTGO|nr:hypothetical protein DBZ45_09000 [Arthrobacter globiformis]